MVVQAAAVAGKTAEKLAMKRAMRSIANKVKKTKFTGEKPSKILYLGVAMIALFKDLLDLVGIGSLPAIGTVITVCLTFLIWILLLLFDKSGGGKKVNRAMARGILMILIGMVEGLFFGLNLLPIETTMVIVLYILAHRAYKKAKKTHDDQAEEEKKNPAPAYA